MAVAPGIPYVIDIPVPSWEPSLETAPQPPLRDGKSIAEYRTSLPPEWHIRRARPILALSRQPPSHHQKHSLLHLPSFTSTNRNHEVHHRCPRPRRLRRRLPALQQGQHPAPGWLHARDVLVPVRRLRLAGLQHRRTVAGKFLLTQCLTTLLTCISSPAPARPTPSASSTSPAGLRTACPRGPSSPRRRPSMALSRWVEIAGSLV